MTAQQPNVTITLPGVSRRTDPDPMGSRALRLLFTDQDTFVYTEQEVGAELCLKVQHSVDFTDPAWLGRHSPINDWI